MTMEGLNVQTRDVVDSSIAPCFIPAIVIHAGHEHLVCGQSIPVRKGDPASASQSGTIVAAAAQTCKNGDR